MKRLALGLILILVLVFALSASVSAAPILPGETNQITLIGEYSMPHLGSIGVGAGFTLTKSLSLGAEYFQDGCISVFANVYLDPVLVNVDLDVEGGFNYAMITGSYVFDLKNIKLAAGVGLETDFSTLVDYYVKLAANAAITKNIALNAQLWYFPADAWYGLSAGITLSY